MGWLDRLWHNPDSPGDAEDDHWCSQNYTISDRGEYEIVDYHICDDGVVGISSQEIVLECTVCGDTTDGYDHESQTGRFIEWEHTDVDVADGFGDGIEIRDNSLSMVTIPHDNLVDDP